MPDGATRTVAHFIDTGEFGGAERALLHLLRNHDRARWRPVLIHHPGEGLAPLLDGAREAGVPLHPVPRMKRLRGALRLPEFMRTLGEVRPAVFHAHLNWPLACSAALLGAALRVPARLATVQLFGPLPRALTLGMQRRAVVRTVGRYIAVSEEVAHLTRKELGAPADRVSVIHNAVEAPGTPADGSGVRREFGLQPGQPLVLVLARLTAQKGLAHLVDAAAQVPEAVFVVAGEGPDRAALEGQVARLGLAARVRLAGFRDDTAALLAACDLFVLPSLYEGLPLSVLEAMAAGKAVVASAIPGVAEAVVHGETGLLVPAADARALAGAVRSLLADPAGAGAMGAAGAERVRARFSAATMARSVETAYDELLDELLARSTGARASSRARS